MVPGTVHCRVPHRKTELHHLVSAKLQLLPILIFLFRARFSSECIDLLFGGQLIQIEFKGK